MPDVGLLALVADDPLAPKLLAWWKAAKPTLEEAREQLPHIASLLREDSPGEVRLTIERCVLAGLIVDGEITKLASQWLTHELGKRLGMKPAPAKPKAEPPAKEPA